MRVILLLLLGCGCAGAEQTCVMDRVSYAGPATGTVFVTGAYRDPSGAPAGSEALSFPSVAIALAWGRAAPGTIASGGGSCWGSGIERHLTVEVTAWIDVGARVPAGSLDGVAPQPGDPVGHATVAISDFALNYVDIQIRDP